MSVVGIQFCASVAGIKRCVTIIRKANMPKRDRSKFVPVELLDIPGSRSRIRLQRFHLHQALRACQNSVKLRQITGYPGERTLYLRDQLHDRCQRSIGNAPGENASRAIDHTDQNHSLHSAGKTGVGQIGDTVAAHSGCLVRFHCMLCAFHRRLLCHKSLDHHQALNSLLQENTECAIALPHIFVHFLEH